ncbi:hypothetical protein [Streptomyces sp. CH-036]|uniref:hypothetical protein n=1 Tax=Streptomyces sp. CH-036 TaxID=3406733 RepID=UPI003C75B6F4
MKLTPATAALLGAGVTGFFTLLAGLSTQWLTRSRDREQRVWEKRAAVYEDVLVLVQRLAQDRQELVRDGAAGDWDPDLVSENYSRVFAKLEIYGSDGLIKAHKESDAALMQWLTAFVSWRSRAGQNPEIPQPGQNAAWDDFLEKARAAEATDEAFVAKLRADTLAIRPRRRWYQR